jgi:diadenosine tetraphosphatase ApaH/serine/threonine PP2A family protein phosphatase
LRTAILTDIHGNLPALEQVLARCRGLGVDRYVCLGDTVGYGAQPNECCDLVRERASFSLLGNHDAAVAGRMNYDYYYDAARDALDWTRGELTASNRAWLASLPYTVREGPVEYCHGSPLEPAQYEYIFLLEQAEELVPVVADLAEMTFIGHSHLPRAYAISPEGARSVLADQVELRPGFKYIVSIGSVGQPRDGDPRACFGVLDDGERTLTYHRVAYDIDHSASRILAAGLSAHFARRLYAGV